VTLVVDASVAVLWVLQQPGSDRADKLRVGERLVAPSLIAAEIGNALWKAVRRGDSNKADALVALKTAILNLDGTIPLEELHSRALELAMELDHPIYDCFYLALAERERCPLVTADKRLLTAAKKMKEIEVRAL
jgi:predicted nucleic acid-binding protein